MTPIVVSYPKELPLDYDDLQHYLVERVEAKAPFAILAESFSGPLALRLAAKSPPNLVAVILCATFVESPLPQMSSRVLSALIEKILKLPLPKFLIRHLLVGKKASNELIGSFCEIMKTVNPRVLATRIQYVEVELIDSPHFLLQCRPRQASEAIQSFLKRRKLCFQSR